MRQYPVNTFGPFTSMAPTTPLSQGLPSPSTTRTEIPGNAGPTVPAIRSPSSGFDVFIPVSVMP